MEFSLVFIFRISSAIVLENSATAAGLNFFFKCSEIGFEVFDLSLDVSPIYEVRRSPPPWWRGCWNIVKIYWLSPSFSLSRW